MRFASLVLALALCLAMSPDVATARQAGSPPPVTASDRILGRADAPVTVIEYASFTCSRCAAWHTQVYPAFKTRFIDTGRVRLVFRNLPTAPVREATAAAAIGRCARPERFPDVAQAFFSGQPGLFQGGTETWFSNAVAVSGRTREEITACFADPATQATLNAQAEGAAAAGVTGTPGFFVNGRAVTDTSLAGLSAAIAAATPGN